MSDKIKGMSGAFIANLIFGFSFLFSGKALAVADVFVLLTLRFFLSLAVIGVLIVTGVLKVNLSKKAFLDLLPLGLMQPFLYFIFEQYGIKLTNSAFSGVMIALVPVAATFISIPMLHEKPTVLQIVFGIVSMAAVSILSVMSGEGGKIHFLGVVFLALAVVCASLFNIFSRKASVMYSAVEKTFVMFVYGFAGFFIIGLLKIKGGFFKELLKATANGSFLISLLYLSILSSVVAFLLYNYATSKITVPQSTAFSNVITVTSLIAGIFIEHTHFTLVEILLCAVIIVSVICVNTF